MKKITSPSIGLLDARYLKLDQTVPQTLTDSPIFTGFTNASIPFFFDGQLNQDNSHLTFNNATYDLYAYTISTTGLTVTGWTPGWVLYAGAGGSMVGEGEFNYATDTNTLSVANIISSGEINGTYLTTANLTLNANVITSDTGLVHFNDDNLYTAGYMQANYFASDVATGTSPYLCTSTTLNSNLNADLLDGQHGAYYQQGGLCVLKVGDTMTGALVVENDTTFGKLGSSTYTEDFEDGTLGDFTTSGDVSWAVENTVVHAGTYAVKSGTITDGQSSSLQLITTIAKDSLFSFYYKASTEAYSDACRTTIDGVYVDTLTGTVDWTQKKYWLSAGTHTIIFKFARDVGGSAGTNSIYLDDFDITTYEYKSNILGNLRVGNSPQTGISIHEVDGFINTNKGYMINGAPAFNSVGWSYFAGYNAGGATLPGVMNTVIGYEAGLGSGATGFIGNWSTLIGYQAGKACTTGYYNTFVGAWAGLTVTTGYNNTIFGEAGGSSLTEGYYNTFLGRLSGFKVVTGYRNTCVGAINLHGSATTAQIENVALGYSAGRYVAGNYNTLLGSYAGDGITSGSSNIALGYKAEVPTATASNQLSLGNLLYGTGIDGTDTTISTGNIGIGVKAPGSRLVVKGTGATSATSSLNITDSADNSKFFVRDDGNVGIGTTSPAQKLHVAGIGLITDKLAFTQTDLNEYIDSGLDGWINIGATTGVEVNAPVLNGVLAYFTDGYDCGDAGGFSGIKWNATDTQLEVWIDGSKIGHFSSDGTYTDDV